MDYPDVEKIASEIEELDRRRSELEQERDFLLRRHRMDGARMVDLVKASRITKARIYRILGAET
ncbi:hypothetical protein [Microbacterium sp. NPDC055455]